jgi:hypothetical protein
MIKNPDLSRQYRLILLLFQVEMKVFETNMLAILFTYFCLREIIEKKKLINIGSRC